MLMDVLLRVTNAIDHDLYCQMGIAKYVCNDFKYNLNLLTNISVTLSFLYILAFSLHYI